MKNVLLALEIEFLNPKEEKLAYELLSAFCQRFVLAI